MLLSKVPLKLSGPLVNQELSGQERTTVILEKHSPPPIFFVSLSAMF